MAEPLISPPILVDPDDLAQVAYETLQSYYPLWEPSDADALTRFIQAFAALVAEKQSLATQAVTGLIQYFGSAQGLPPNAATAASGVSTWTLSDDTGHTIPAGTHLYLTADDGTQLTFIAQDDVTVAPGSSTTAPGEVAVIAEEPGAAGSGLSGTGQLLDDLSFVSDIELVGITTGGQDAETTLAYLRRYAKFSKVLRATPILPVSFALLTEILHTDVQRALAIDGYDPGPPVATGQARCITVIPIDTAGQPMPGPTKDAIQADLAARRETTFEVFVIDPTYTPIDIDATGPARPGYDPAAVQTAVETALAALVDPAAWGLPLYGDAAVWVDQPTLRYQDAVTALNNVEGFDHYDTLTLNGDVLDIALPGPGALPQAGTITATVTAP